MTPPVRVALFGNSFASRIQLPALRWAGGARVVGVAGRDEARLRETADAWSIERWSTDWRALLEPAPDLVIVTTPVDLHAEMVTAALDAGAAVLCEKPFAMDAAEAERLVAAASGRPAWLDHQLRFSPYRRRVRALLAEGALGEVRHGRFELHLGSPLWFERPHTWWFEAERGGGILGAIGSHLIDLLRFELGPVAAVRAELATFVADRRTPDGEARPVTADEYASLTLRMASGARIEVATSCVSPNARGFRYELFGSAGTLRLDDEQDLRFARLGDELAPVEVVEERPSFEEIGIDDRSGPFARSLPLYLRALLEAVAEGRSAVADAATFADGLAVQRVLDAARESARTGGGFVDAGSA